MNTPTPLTPSFTLITGASKGIGRELAREAARSGQSVILVARDRAGLESLAAELTGTYSVQAEVLIEDLSKEGAAARVFEAVQAKGLHVENLINNAGFGLYGELLSLDPQQDRDMLQVNMITLTEMTRLFAGPMVKSGRGRIMNVASTAAFQPGPLMSTYYASKSFVLSLSEALANELEPRSVTVTALCPGATPTGFQERSSLKSSMILNKGIMTSAPYVAKIGFESMMKGRRVVIPGLLHCFMAWSTRFLPRRLLVDVSRRAIEQKELA
ncbi:SDR family oxidoreductase [bacterium]|nr:SDR family oxidoreductase [bacterium]